MREVICTGSNLQRCSRVIGVVGLFVVEAQDYRSVVVATWDASEWFRVPAAAAFG